jgi:hypothetical protein
MSFSEDWGVFLETPCVLPSEVSSAPAIECAVYWMLFSHHILEVACSIVTFLPATWLRVLELFLSLSKVILEWEKQ